MLGSVIDKSQLEIQVPDNLITETLSSNPNFFRLEWLIPSKLIYALFEFGECCCSSVITRNSALPIHLEH